MAEAAQIKEVASGQSTRESLCEHVQRDGTLTPANAALLTAALAAAMSEPAGADRDWDSLRAGDVFVDSESRVTFAVNEMSTERGYQAHATRAPGGAARTQACARLVVEMLTGQFDLPVTAASPASRLEAAAIPPRLVAAVVRGAQNGMPDADLTVLEYSRGFGEAVEATASDLIGGAWEAIGRGDDAMALLLVDHVDRYHSGHPELTVLLARLNPSSIDGTIAALSLPGPQADASLEHLLGAGAVPPAVSSTNRATPKKPPLVPVLLFGSMIGFGGFIVVFVLALTFR